MRPLNNRGLIRKENMFILNNIDDDLRVLIDLDDNSDVNDVGVDTLPYTFILLEDKTYWDEFEEIKRKPQWEVIFSEKFNEYSFILDLPDIIRNKDSFKESDTIYLRSKYSNGSDWRIRKTDENDWSTSEDYVINILKGSSKRRSTDLVLYESDMEELINTIEEAKKILGLDKKRIEEEKMLQYKLNDEVYITFRPNHTTIHGFDNNPPKNWNDVYKVYYSFSVDEKWEYEGDVQWYNLLDATCDECSCIPYLAEALECFDANAKHDVVKLQAMGDGVDWEIEKFYFKFENKYYYNFKLFYGKKGCRFTLSENEMYNFVVWLKYINEYAFKVCGCPI